MLTPTGFKSVTLNAKNGHILDLVHPKFYYELHELSFSILLKILYEIKNNNCDARFKIRFIISFVNNSKNKFWPDF